MKITHIRINGLERPMGFQPEPMVLSWLTQEARGQTQAEARVQVWAQGEAAPLWERRGDLPWEGTRLDFVPRPRTRYQVKVEVWDDQGGQCAGESWFETGKLGEPWLGRWISPVGEARVPVLAGTFPGAEQVERARLYITGLGLYTARLNGRPVTDEVLAPGLCDYEQEVYAQTYDITPLLERDNRLEVTLGNGWYRGRFGLHRDGAFGDRLALRAEVHLTLADGSRRVYCAGPGWTWTESGLEPGGIYDGEGLDRLAPAGEPQPVEEVDIPLEITDRLGPPVRIKEVLPVAEVLRTPAGETVLDFGQNHTGFLRFRAALPRGCQVRFDFGEVLQQGNFYNENYRTARGGFRYRSDGREETVCQQFTYYGFRYVRVTGWPGELDPADFSSPVVYSDLEQTGSISCGHAGVDRLCRNALWSQKSNFLEIPTDCPQRDERLGWTGDAQVFAPTACYFMDCRAFYRKFLAFLRREQLRHGGAVPTYVPSMGDFRNCAIWSDAAVIIPDILLRMTGSVDEVAGYYPMMKDWVDWVACRHPGHLYDTGFQLGDWLAQDGITPQSFKGGTDDVFLATAYYWQSAALVARLAGLMERKGEAEEYQRLADAIRERLLDTYFTPAGRLSVDTQAAYIVALKLGLYREREVVLAQLRRRLRYDGFSIRCGFVGAPLLCQTLSQQGMDRLACDFLLNPDFPGWLYCVNLGATTIWERWNSLLEDGTCSGTGMNSFNHYAYGSVAEYVFAWLGGIRPLELGFRRAVIDPRPDVRLGWLECACRTVSGQYRCRWEIRADGMVELEVDVPFGCTAQVTLPHSGRPALEVGAGRHRYCYRPEDDLRRLYGPDTRLGQLADDPRAREILGRELPQLLALLEAGNGEFTTQTFRELGKAFFLGLNEEKMERLVEALETLQYAPAPEK